MKTFEVKTEYATYKDCFLYTNHYIADNSLYIGIENYDEGPIATLTVCLDACNNEDESFVDTNNFLEGPKLIESLGIGKPTGKFESSGFCVYPQYKFDLAKIAEYEYKEENK